MTHINTTLMAHCVGVCVCVRTWFGEHKCNTEEIIISRQTITCRYQTMYIFFFGIFLPLFDSDRGERDRKVRHAETCSKLASQVGTGESLLRAFAPMWFAP